MKTEEFVQREMILSPEEAIKYRNSQLEIASLKEENADLKAQLAQYKKLVYGQKSEKTEYILENAEQQNLFDEAECEENRREREAEKAVVVPEHTRKPKRTHAEMAANLETEEVVHRVESPECTRCGSVMSAVGREFVRDELVYVPARLFVRKHYAEVLKCPGCGCGENDAALPDIEKCSFKKAAVPVPMIPHSFCSPE